MAIQVGITTTKMFSNATIKSTTKQQQQQHDFIN